MSFEHLLKNMSNIGNLPDLIGDACSSARIHTRKKDFVPDRLVKIDHQNLIDKKNTYILCFCTIITPSSSFKLFSFLFPIIFLYILISRFIFWETILFYLFSFVLVIFCKNKLKVLQNEWWCNLWWKQHKRVCFQF